VSKAALLIMDVQPHIIDRLEDKAVFLERLQAVAQAAKARGLAVFYIVVGFRAGFPEVSPHNASFHILAESASDYLIDPQPAVPVAADDIVVRKLRVSAFSGSDLEVLLRAQGITDLVLSGIATSGVVLSTLREAADKDYRLTVLSDLCADGDPTVHDVLLTKVFPHQATVLTSDVWLQTIGAEGKEQNV